MSRLSMYSNVILDVSPNWGRNLTMKTIDSSPAGIKSGGLDSAMREGFSYPNLQKD